MAKIAAVALSNTTRRFDKEYHYCIPERLAKVLVRGMRVIVPFGKGDRLMEAFVLSIEEASMVEGLKEVHECIGEVSVLDDGLMKLAAWMRDRYLCTWHDAAKAMLPPGLGLLTSHSVRLTGGGDPVPKSLQSIVDILAGMGGEMDYDELMEKSGVKTFATAVKKLQDLGIVTILREFSPRIGQKSMRVAFLAKPADEILALIESDQIKSIQQIRILEMLLEDEPIPTADLTRFAGVSPGVLNTLKKKGFIHYKEIEVPRDPYGGKVFQKTLPMTPTMEQQRVLDDLRDRMGRNEFSQSLLHGITGSGKTEVYMQLIATCIAGGKQAIMLVPEISLTPQMVERFKGRFGDAVAVLHSRLSLGERVDQWKAIREGRVDIVVGARSAVFAPLGRLGLIILDEEHETSYKSEVTPKYHAREVAVKRGHICGAMVLLGSATPSVDTYWKALGAEMGLHVLSSRPNLLSLPEVELVDMRSELDKGNRSMFSSRLETELLRNIRDGQQTVLFINRRGHSSFILCRSCGYVVKCPNCNISLTYHQSDGRVICHYCGYTIRKPEGCPKCKSPNIRHFGVGTQKIEEEVANSFPGCSVLRMDLDTTGYKNSHEEILHEFRSKNVNVLVGTQMIAKGHDFPNVTLVGVLAADSLLNAGDYNSSERTFQLITQVAGRAGRGGIPGRVVIQTYNTDDYSIRAACAQDYSSFYAQEIQVREKLGYPPFTSIGIIILSGAADRQTYDESLRVKGFISEVLKDEGMDTQIFGPSRAPLARLRNKYRWRIILKEKNMDALLVAMGRIRDGWNPPKGKMIVEMNMDINPVNML